MPPRDFDAERRARILAEPLHTFILGGQEYTLRPAIDPAAIADFERISQPGKDGDITPDQAITMMDDVFCMFILPSQEERYRAARQVRFAEAGATAETADEVREAALQVIDIDTVTDVIAWMIEKVTGRPFLWPEDSSPSSDSNGTPSTGISSSTESMPPRLISGAS